MNRSVEIYELTKINKDLIKIIEGYLYPDYKQQYEYIIWQLKIYQRDGFMPLPGLFSKFKFCTGSKIKFYMEDCGRKYHNPCWTKNSRDLLLHKIQT